ncbi:TPA: hypothetical protein AB5C39_004278, partial [Vibrio mimicus]
RITLNSNTKTVTTAAQWDWKRQALTVPLEALVMLKLQHFTLNQTTVLFKSELTQILPIN